MKDQLLCANWADKLAIKQEELPVAEQAALNTHLAICSACAVAYADYQLLIARIRTLPEPRVKPSLRLSSEPSSQQKNSNMRTRYGKLALNKRRSKQTRNDFIQFPSVTFSGKKAWRQRLSMIAAVFFVALVVGALALLFNSSHQGSSIHPGGIMGKIKEFPLANTSPIGLSDITAGPDGNLWFPEQALSGYNCQIGRITPTGKVSEFPLPAPEFVPGSLTVGPDGNLWFPEVKGTSNGPSGKIGRITPTGQISEFSLPSPGNPGKLMVGPDGNLWFTSGGFSAGGQIGRITPAGTITEFPLPASNSDPGDITVGPDGNLWFTVSGDPQFAKIGRITMAGTITTFSPPSSSSSSIKIFVSSIITGSDGNLWFTERVQISKNSFVNKIDRITPRGTISEFRLPDPNASLSELAIGPDHNLWFAEVSLNYSNGPSSKIGRITPTGKISEFPSHALQSSISSDISGYHRSIITGPDGNLWFIETQFTGTGKIGHITTEGEISEFLLPTQGNNPIGITIGPDGKLWFTESSPDGRNARIGHLV